MSLQRELDDLRARYAALSETIERVLPDISGAALVERVEAAGRVIAALPPPATPKTSALTLEDRQEVQRRFEQTFMPRYLSACSTEDLPELDPAKVEQHGWVRIGALCSTGRRSLWLRFQLGVGPGTLGDRVWRIDLRAGREGCDEYVEIPPTNPLFHDLIRLFATAEFAATT